MSLINGEEIELSVASSAMTDTFTNLIQEGYITVEDLIYQAIRQLEICDCQHLGRVLPEETYNKLINTYESVKNGDNHV
ncbi:hypothetical protein [Pantoea sp. RSPAM1]|uniref:hypothetical protein n=1 Tax=Pantoea sp. RSPAM1 TaxID=2675223 RepID=UPI00315D46A6